MNHDAKNIGQFGRRHDDQSPIEQYFCFATGMLWGALVTMGFGVILG